MGDRNSAAFLDVDLPTELPRKINGLKPKDLFATESSLSGEMSYLLYRDVACAVSAIHSSTSGRRIN